ncbi:MAG: ABC transporter substrate-binding protein [Leptospirillia bacterium]
MRIRLLVTLVFCVLLAGCTTEKAPPLRIGTNVWPGYEPLYLAQEIGALDDAEVRLVEYSSATQVLRAFRNNLIDAAALTLDESLRLLASGLEPRVVLVMDVSDGADAIIARPGIEDIKDLKGLRIGVEDGALGAFFLHQALERAGLTESDLVVVPVEIDEQENAYSTHHIDAAVTFDPVRSRLLSQGAVQVFDSSEIPGTIVDVLVVRKSFLDHHPGQVKKALAGWYKGVTYLKSSPKAASAFISERLGVEPTMVLETYAGIHIPDQSENRTLLSKGNADADLAEIASRLNSIMMEHNIITDSVSTDLLFDITPTLLSDSSS